MRLLHEDFQDLVDDVIVNHSSRNYRRACEGREEFEQTVRTWRRELRNPSIGLTEAPCTFPKGRKSDPEEDDLTCALRESEEETHIPARLISTYDDIEPLEEIYTGLDGRLYKTVYFVGFVDFETFRRISPDIRTKFVRTKTRATLSDEISKVKWLTYEQANAKFDAAKRYILRMVNTFLIFHLDRKPPQRRHSFTG